MTSRPSDIEAWLVAGQTALDAGHHTDAAAAFARVQHALPGEITAALLVANAWRLAGNTVAVRDALLSAFRHATDATSGPAPIESAEVTAIYELGAALLDAGAPTEARRLFERVVRKRPKDPAALGALAGATRAEGDPQRAWPIVQRAMAIAPKQPALLLTAAQIRHALGDLTRARYWLDRAETVRPAHVPTRLQRALTSLLEGPSAEGWADFEHRGLPTPPDTGAAAWHGEPLDAQSILVTAEQGQGDNFQFVRYVAALSQRGASRVVVECHPGALSLFIASGFDAVAKGEAPVTDWYVPMLSLPHRLGAGADVASAGIPYLRTGVAARPSAAPSRRRRVGVVWRGNPAFLSTTLRDFDPALLPRLLDIPDVEWVSLQVGATIGETPSTFLKPQLSLNWLDTALLLEQYDALVSVDTGTAHLAGAMGIPTYILLPFTPDWRWGLATDATPWYPAARLIRQRAPRDWASVVEALARALGS
ncbi:tetratricopeptide repeat protein [Gemmatimonas groenlandica]|uniref:Tetratricopeptide repeat protein n=1 Tax=Gemmatimonas groenlandica TaxID=2732249 RepID=A0A6M4IQL6_9BACT|nr:tetratricopeptide repeat protein [Gemmatimonas groenlandica]QJR36435.1 tetratricopeptide repeat protein [Gemmatimonas groenlandica]